MPEWVIYAGSALLILAVIGLIVFAWWESPQPGLHIDGKVVRPAPVKPILKAYIPRDRSAHPEKPRPNKDDFQAP